MQFLKRHKLEIILGAFIICLYLFLRVYHILNLPIFTDEAIYIRWSQIAKQDANWRFISLTDGKQPMFVWIAMILLRLFHDPILSGRMVSVFAGLGTTIGLFFLGKEIFKNRWIGLISSFIYVVYPFGLVYDRMALYDSLVAAFAVWGWYLTVILVRKIRSDISFILGLVLGGGMLTKTSDFFIAAVMPASLLLFNFKQKERIKKLMEWLAYAVLSVALALVYYSVLRLSPFYTIIDQKDAIFVYPLSQWILSPFAYLQDNLRGLVDWFISYVKFPLFVLILGSFFYYKDFLKEKILLVIWFITPFLYLAFFGRTLYPRFILFMTIALLPLAAYTLFRLTLYVKDAYLKIIIVLLFVSFSIYADYFIIFDFSHAPIPKSDLGQYINDWPAGNGVKESIDFFRQQAQNQKIFIATEGTFGLMPYALEMYLVDNPNIIIRGIWPIKDSLPKEISEASKKMPTYVLFYQPCPSCLNTGDAPISWPVSLIARYRQGTGNSYLSVYQVNK